MAAPRGHFTVEPDLGLCHPVAEPILLFSSELVILGVSTDRV
jgi:hypothetical protein